MRIIQFVSILTIGVIGVVSDVSRPLQFATMFARISDELDHMSLGNCNLSAAALPVNNTKVKLPTPSSSLNLKYVALGRGTQNYSCSTSNSSAKPVAVGAAAALFDASCLASASMTLLHEVPAVIRRTSLGSLAFMAEMLSLTTNKTDLIIGEHYFDASGDPYFDLRLGGANAWMVATKKASVDAPIKDANSCSNVSSEDVAWLELERKTGNGVERVYRVMTSGGSPPLTCAGQNKSVLIKYAAEYWFYG
ncbi:hypothetical protein N7495_004375 [Penicillium taxi]|uniref:uncharacterized protein n=1 Tax=Penicillium taxi TaxID=168475 RepID=UPI002545B194|nr:uncharacterized protein N7495_004375 [Penicillium taxi]KAJ5899631.1 hypothetical protein N7495_004375 [Penicillium taxi]